MTATDALFKVIAEKVGVETMMKKKSRKQPTKRIPARQKASPVACPRTSPSDPRATFGLQVDTLAPNQEIHPFREMNS